VRVPQLKRQTAAEASVIAVAPIAPPLPDIHMPKAADVAASVELSAFVNPLTTLIDVIQTSIGNLSTTGGQVLADPFPVLRQIAANQLGYLTTLGTAGLGLASALTTFATTTLPTALQTALGQLLMGDVAGAVGTINTAIITGALGLLGP
jgi:hypothetical protein